MLTLVLRFYYSNILYFIGPALIEGRIKLIEQVSCVHLCLTQLTSWFWQHGQLLIFVFLLYQFLSFCGTEQNSFSPNINSLGSCSARYTKLVGGRKAARGFSDSKLLFNFFSSAFGLVDFSSQACNQIKHSF